MHAARGDAAILAALLFADFNDQLPDFLGLRLPLVVISLLEMGFVRSLLGGYRFGVYLYVSSKKYSNMNHNDAFGLMRLDTHKNFLRIRIPEDEVIYPIASRTAERRLDAEPGKERFGTALESLKPPPSLAQARACQVLSPRSCSAHQPTSKTYFTRSPSCTSATWLSACISVRSACRGWFRRRTLCRGPLSLWLAEPPGSRTFPQASPLP